jgi:predicted SAM-dependent methyltransferase
VLVPGGKVRLTTPDLAVYIRMFQEPPPAELQEFFQKKLQACGWPRTVSPACMILNRQLREWGHLFLYDRKTLHASLEAAGFGQIQEFAPGQSDDPNLRGVDIRDNLPRSRELNAYESMVMQGVKR